MSSDEQPPVWMTVADLAEHLRLSRSKVYKMAQLGEIPCSRVAGRWRFFRAEIDEWMFKRREPHARRSTKNRSNG